MIRLAISAEGQTEEAFVKEILVNHLRPSGIEPDPVLIKRARSGGRKIGGCTVSVDVLVSEMVHLRRSYDAVTSLVDF